MAYFDLVPFKIDFTTPDGTALSTTNGGIIHEGTRYLRTLQVRDAGGAPIPCDEFGATAPRCDFRTGPIDSPDNGTTAGCPQPGAAGNGVLAWSNASVGLITFEIAMATWTAWSSNTARVSKGVFQIELTHSTGAKTRAFYGEWEVSKEVTA